MLNIILWIAQFLLALVFFRIGYNHALNSERMKAQRGIQWIAAFPRWLMTFIGLSEIAGGLGAVLPALTGIPAMANASGSLLAGSGDADSLFIPRCTPRIPKPSD